MDDYGRKAWDTSPATQAYYRLGITESCEAPWFLPAPGCTAEPDVFQRPRRAGNWQRSRAVPPPVTVIDLQMCRSVTLTDPAALADRIRALAALNDPDAQRDGLAALAAELDAEAAL